MKLIFTLLLIIFGMASSYAEVSDTATYSNLYKALRYKGIIGNRYDDFKSENDYRQIIYISSLESPNVRLRDFPKETRFGIYRISAYNLSVNLDHLILIKYRDECVLYYYYDLYSMLRQLLQINETDNKTLPDDKLLYYVELLVNDNDSFEIGTVNIHNMITR